MLLSYHLLYYHRHLLLVYKVLRGGHVSLGVVIVNGGIDSLHGIRQVGKHLIPVVGIRYHVGAVDAGERLVMAVFEQRRGTHRQRLLRGVYHSVEIVEQRLRQLCLQELLQYLLVGRVAQCNLPQVVVVHELVEEVGTQHHGLGNEHLGILVTVERLMLLDDVVEKRQSPALAAQRAVAYPRKVGVGVEAVFVEHGDNAEVLHVAVCHDGIENNLAVLLHVRQPVPCDVLQEL